ncbi:MAG: TIGR00300 family protein [Clostridia bacterium]|nr:TIGR00300 family protein [Clostridia bacterium]
MYTAEIELRGHLIDSLILSRVVDAIIDLGGDFEFLETQIGRTKMDSSYARVEIGAETCEELDEILARVHELGALVANQEEVALAPVEQDGVFPDGFYSTTNLETFINLSEEWVPVQHIEMDCGIVADREKREALCLPMGEVRRGQLVVIGRKGIRIAPMERTRHKEVFSFMGSEISSEKPKARVVGEIAREMKEIREHSGKILVVAGPAVIHTGAGKHLVALIRAGYVNVLFAGNAVAVHDVESALFGTSLGVYLETGAPAAEGHTHHLRAINRIRGLGGLRQAVEAGVLTKGVMHALITENVPFVLAGSIRDDGPLPDVETDTVRAQSDMRRNTEGVEMALMLSSMLHSIATGNLLPARVKTVCVDINPATVTKLADRGTFQAIGIVSDVEWFLKELVARLIEQ